MDLAELRTFLERELALNEEITPPDAEARRATQVRLTIAELRTLVTALKDCIDLEHSFDLYDKAMRRAMRYWHANNPDADPDVWPDVATMVAWLLTNLPEVA